MIFHWIKQLELSGRKAIQYIRLARMGHLKERTDLNRAADQPCSMFYPLFA